MKPEEFAQASNFPEPQPLWKSCYQGRSVGILLFEDNKECSQEDLQVQPDGPLANVAVIVIDALLHLVERFGLAAITFDLRQPVMPGLTL